MSTLSLANFFLSAGNTNMWLSPNTPSTGILLQSTGLISLKGIQGDHVLLGASTGMGMRANGVFGTANQVLTSNGSTTYWGNFPTSAQVFNVSGTWTKPSNGTFIRVQLWGAGAGGGCGANISNAGVSGTSVGGGGGGYSEAIFLLNSLTSTVTVTVGAGGIGNTTLGNPGVPSYGSNGGLSSFGTYLTAWGGNGNGTGGNSISVGVYNPLTAALSIGNANGFTSQTAGAGIGTQTYLGGLPILTPATITANGLQTSIYGGGGTVFSTLRSGNSVWGGGAGGSCSGAPNATGSNGGFSIYGGTGGSAGNWNGLGGNPTAGVAPGGGGGAGAMGATTITVLTSGTNGANGQCIVTVW